jgi:hypothetical protein
VCDGWGPLSRWSRCGTDTGGWWTTFCALGGVDILASVSCRSATFCMAAGSFGGDDFRNGMIQAWNGHKWKFSLALDGPEGETALAAVCCASPTFCMTVGNDGEATVATRFGPG